MKQPHLHRILSVGALLAYLALALPLSFVLLDHQWGILTGDPTHSADDDHAWLDHAAGAGLTSEDAGMESADLVGTLYPSISFSLESFHLSAPPVRGPPSA